MLSFLFPLCSIRGKCEGPRTSKFLVLAALASWFVVWPASPPVAATPRDDLLKLVPSDVGFCVVVSDLREHSEKFRASPWVEALRRSPLARKMAQSPEARKLASLKEQVEKRLHTRVDELRDEILGDAVVFAFQPGPPGKPKQDRGLVMLWARNPKLLAEVVAAVNQGIEIETRAYQKEKYAYRPEKGRDHYYYLSGSLLAFSSSEAMVHQVIARMQKIQAKGKPVASVLDQFRRIGVDKAFLALWFNPRAFDAHLKHHVKKARGPEAVVFQQLFDQYWKALEGMALGILVEKEFEVKVTVRAKTDRLPKAARKFFNEASKPSHLWNYFPPDALLAVAGQINTEAFAAFVQDFLPKAKENSTSAELDRVLENFLGIDLKRDLLPNVGPDWGFCMTAPSDNKTLVPSMIWALRVQSEPKEAPVDKALFQGLTKLASLAAFFSNKKVHLKEVKQGQVKVKYLTNEKEFPAGVRPAFALKQGYLVLASSPETIRGFEEGKGKPATGAAMPLVRVSFRAWGKYLRDHRHTMIGHLAATDGISRKKAEDQLDSLLWGLQLLDHLELTQRTGAGQVTWTLAVRAADISKKTSN